MDRCVLGLWALTQTTTGRRPGIEGVAFEQHQCSVTLKTAKPIVRPGISFPEGKSGLMLHGPKMNRRRYIDWIVYGYRPSNLTISFRTLCFTIPRLGASLNLRRLSIISRANAFFYLPNIYKYNPKLCVWAWSVSWNLLERLKTRCK